MAKIRINGAEYDLRLGLWALDQMEKKYGDVNVAMNKFRRERSITVVKDMFVVMANQGRKHAKQPMDVDADVLDDCSLKDIELISNAMTEALDEAMHAETVGGNEADDEVADGYAAEYEQREKNA